MGINKYIIVKPNYVSNCFFVYFIKGSFQKKKNFIKGGFFFSNKKKKKIKHNLFLRFITLFKILNCIAGYFAWVWGLGQGPTFRPYRKSFCRFGNTSWNYYFFFFFLFFFNCKFYYYEIVANLN